MCVCVYIGGLLMCLHVCISMNLRVCVRAFACVLSEAAPGRGSDIEDGLNPVLHSSGGP